MTVVEYDFTEEPTAKRRICLDCTADMEVLPNTVPVPVDPVEAWKLVSCRGTDDWRLWRWCRVLGEVTQPAAGRRMNHERRKVKICQ